VSGGAAQSAFRPHDAGSYHPLPAIGPVRASNDGVNGAAPRPVPEP